MLLPVQHTANADAQVKHLQEYEWECEILSSHRSLIDLCCKTVEHHVGYDAIDASKDILAQQRAVQIEHQESDATHKPDKF